MAVRSEFQVFRLNEKGLTKSFDVEMIFSEALDALEKVCGKEGRHMALVRTKLEEASSNAQRAIAVDRENQVGGA